MQTAPVAAPAVAKPTAPSPAVLTSAPAAAAVKDAQAATIGTNAPKMPEGMTIPIGATIDYGQGPLVMTSNGLVAKPGTTNPTPAQQAANSNPPPNGTSAAPPAVNPQNGANSGSKPASTGDSGTTPAPSNIPGTDIPSTGDPTTDALISKYQKGMDDLNTWAAGIKTQMDTMRANMDASNQKLFDLLGSTFDSTIAAQQAANDAQKAGMMNLGTRSGLSRYAPELYQSEVKSVVDAGLSKIADIQVKKATALAKAQQANEKQDWQSLYQESQTLQKLKSDEQTQTLDLLKSVQTAQKNAQQAAKDAATAQQAQEKLDHQQAQDHAYAILSALDAEAGMKGESTLEQDQAMVKEYAAAWGLDPQSLLAAVEQLKMTKDNYGSGPIGQYQFYADFEKSQGRTPMNFNDWNVNTAAEKAAAVAAAKKTAPGSSAGNQLTKAQYAKLNAVGIPQERADKITSAILAGASLDQIRQALTKDQQNGIGGGPKELDEYDNAVGIAALLKNKKPKAGTSASFQ